MLQDHAFFGTARTGGGGGFHPTLQLFGKLVVRILQFYVARTEKGLKI